MTLTPAQEQAMWRFVLSYARYWYGPFPGEGRQGVLDAARALLEVSEPPKESLYPYSEIFTILIGMIGPGDPYRIRTHVDRALGLIRQQMDALEAMGAKNDRLEERIEKAIYHCECAAQSGEYEPEAAMRTISALRGEDK